MMSAETAGGPEDATVRKPGDTSGRFQAPEKGAKYHTLLIE
jgi:hypothetical protein